MPEHRHSLSVVPEKQCQSSYHSEGEHNGHIKWSFIAGHARNLLHFFVEDWFLSAMLGILTAIFSICIDVMIEYLNHCEFLLNFNLNNEETHMVIKSLDQLRFFEHLELGVEVLIH